MSVNNDYRNLNGAKMLGDKAGKATQRAIRKVGLKLAKKLGAVALKKLGTALLVKTAPIWGGILAILFVVLAMISVFMPDVSANKASEYTVSGSELGIPAKHLLAFDTVLYENEDMEERNPSDSAYYFLRIMYEKFTPEREECVMYGRMNECLSYKTIPEKILEHKEYQGKKAIQDFLKSKGQPIDNIPEALKNIRDQLNTRIMVTTLPVEIAMEQANFTEEQKEHYNGILEAGFIDEEFPDMGFSLGFGAYCSPTKEIDESAWRNAFANAGVFTTSGDKIIEIAEKRGIDPIIMAAIAFHETGFGTSNAVVNKNNPGGLMNPNGSGLFVFPTLNDGLESLGKTLHNRIVKDGKTTIEMLGAVYAPVGAANDPTGLNNHWVPNMTRIVQNLGGLTMNCEANSFMPIGIDGATSETASIIAGAGYKYIGNSVYKFGGGRNEADIARGYLDCSSFVHWAFKQGGVSLGPLTSVSTETLNKTGKRITMSEIKVGDLIFWDTYKKDGHVGIYIGNGKWIGSQSSTGVAIVDVNSPYWSSVFSGHVRSLLP